MEYYPDLNQMEPRQGLVAYWDFAQSEDGHWLSQIGQERHVLKVGGGSPRQLAKEDGGGLQFDGVEDYLVLRHPELGALNISGSGAGVTVVAWLEWNKCQVSFIGGIWQEHNDFPKRQYGLFIHLPSYGGGRAVCGHVSKNGGPSPGLPYSRDYSASLSPLPCGEPVVAAFTYDGREMRSYLNGRFESRPHYTEPGPPMGEGISYSKNPYIFPDGLGDNGGDFTVGAVRLTDGMRNHFAGKLFGLAVFSRALKQDDLASICGRTGVD